MNSAMLASQKTAHRPRFGGSRSLDQGRGPVSTRSRRSAVHSSRSACIRPTKPPPNLPNLTTQNARSPVKYCTSARFAAARKNHRKTVHPRPIVGRITLSPAIQNRTKPNKPERPGVQIGWIRLNKPDRPKHTISSKTLDFVPVQPKRNSRPEHRTATLRRQKSRPPEQLA